MSLERAGVDLTHTFFWCYTTVSDAMQEFLSSHAGSSSCLALARAREQQAVFSFFQEPGQAVELIQRRVFTIALRPHPSCPAPRPFLQLLLLSRGCIACSAVSGPLTTQLNPSREGAREHVASSPV